MSTELAIHLSEQAYSSLAAAAVAAGKTPAEQAAAVVETIFSSPQSAAADADDANLQFEQCFGSVDLGRPVGIENATIDADVAHQHGAAHGS